MDQGSWALVLWGYLPQVALAGVAVMIACGVWKVIFTPLPESEPLTEEEIKILAQNPTSLFAPNLQTVEEEKMRRKKRRIDELRKKSSPFNFTVTPYVSYPQEDCTEKLPVELLVIVFGYTSPVVQVHNKSHKNVNGTSQRKHENDITRLRLVCKRWKAAMESPLLPLVLDCRATHLDDAGLETLFKQYPVVWGILFGWSPDITDKGLACISHHCPYLTHLEICDAKVTQEGLTNFIRNSPHLIHFAAMGIKAMDRETVKELCKCRALREVRLRYQDTTLISDLETLHAKAEEV